MEFLRLEVVFRGGPFCVNCRHLPSDENQHKTLHHLPQNSQTGEEHRPIAAGPEKSEVMDPEFEFPSGTKMKFRQAHAPTGWKVTHTFTADELSRDWRPAQWPFIECEIKPTMAEFESQLPIIAAEKC